MRYVALLRGINVGGNNSIKMLVLKKAFEDAGFTKVLTYIQSGNVLFESAEKNNDKLTKQIETMLSKTFSYQARVIVKSQEELTQIVSQVPPEWKTDTNIRCYIAFLANSLTADEAEKEITLQQNIDFLKKEAGVLYMTTILSGLTKSAFNKLASKKIYQDMTIRNYNTVRKILSLMQGLQ